MGIKSIEIAAPSDEIWEYNEETGKDEMVAYWDEELEYYIYLRDKTISKEPAL